MNPGRLYSIVSSLNENKKNNFKKTIIEKMKITKDDIADVPLESLLIVLYSVFEQSFHLNKLPVVAYGAGKMAQKYIPEMSEKIEFLEIWDAYSKLENICEIPVVRPFEGKATADIPIVIFIDDQSVRYSVIELLNKNGHENIYYFRDYINIIEGFGICEAYADKANESIKELIEKLYSDYEVLESPELPAVFSVLNNELKNMEIPQSTKIVETDLLAGKLNKVLTVEKIPQNEYIDALRIFINSPKDTFFSLAYNLEFLLRNILSYNVKTIERPMRMEDDKPYDQFALYEILVNVLSVLFDDEYAAHFVDICADEVQSSIPLIGAKCFFAVKIGQYESALHSARKIVKKYPNNLLANEILYQAVCACRNNGISVGEPVHNYDLNKRFCWSGLNFAWCGGFDIQNGDALFAPCFRPLQCAARPEGEFWTSDDWKEFRKSVTDGSFRYCQKLQCPNIVAGWLPEKSKVTDSWLKEIFDGNYDVIPPVEELHFSYDDHCNLMCPSCRTEIKTISREQSLRLDELYKKNLEPLTKNAKHLTLSGCGEAIISPHSKNVLKSFSVENNPDLAVELRTNVCAVNENSWNSLGEGRQVIRHITASIDAACKETFEKLRYPAKWHIVIKNLEFIKSLRNSGEIDMFEFHVVVQKENLNQLYDIVKMAMEYDADAVTFSKLINWRGMLEDEYADVNPFWVDSPYHGKLINEINRIEKLRDSIECGEYKINKKFYINMHFSPDPNSSYDEIRIGKLKIR